VTTLSAPLDADSIRQELILELAKQRPDERAISVLADQLAETVSGAARFSVDAHHINRLGLELVAKQETALSELIKNAHDADATRVEISFKDYKSPGGTLTISDDGLGMSEEVIKRTWMRISTTDKSDTPTSPKFGRRRAGKKGIGRFAVQRLGRRLVLETRVSGESFGTRVTFNWDEDFAPGIDLRSVWNPVDRFPKDVRDHGTTLQILDLRDGWNTTTLERVWRSVFFLQPPFKVNQVSDLCSDADPGFKVDILGLGKDEQAKDELSMESLFLSHATGLIDAEVSEDGTASVTFSSRFLEKPETIILQGNFANVGPTKLHAHYFVYNNKTMPGPLVKKASEMGQRYGGIRVYRNGFRVLPYGEPNDDWLNLAYDSARRNILIPGNNYNFFGEVGVSSEQNPYLEETSSREGLIENASYDNLKRFVRTALIAAITRIGVARNRKINATQKDFVPERKPSEIIGEGLAKIQIAHSTDSESNDQPPDDLLETTVDTLRKAQEAAVQYERASEEASVRHIEYENMLRIVSSLGLSIAMFGHEIKASVNGVTGSLTLLQRAIAQASEPLASELRGHLEALQKAVSRMFDVGGYIETVTSSSESRNLRSIAMDGRVLSFFGQFESYFQSRNIQCKIDIVPGNYRTTPMHGSEIDAILFNLMSNSVKALQAGKPSTAKMRVAVEREDDSIRLSVEDNGIGIPEEDRDRIFDAFFTTSQSDGDTSTGLGTGLGLKILKDIADSYGGSIQVGNPTDDYSTRIDFRIPKG
jgi:signal transduction histidine kinase